MTTQMANQPARDISLQVRRVIKGSRRRIFEAWIRPELLQQWFGPAALNVAKVEADVRVGGSYRIEMEGVSENCVNPDGEPVGPRRPVAMGKYVEIVPDEKLSFTWRGDWGDMGDTLVEIQFNDVPGGTEVVLTHTNFANDQMKQGHNKGWEESFDKLERFVEA